MAYGVGIFETELAQSIRRDFSAAVEQGHSLYAASDLIVEQYKEHDGVTLYLALSVLQMELGFLSIKLKKKALTLIISGEAREAWLDSHAAVLAARDAVLDDLIARLRDMPS